MRRMEGDGGHVVVPAVVTNQSARYGSDSGLEDGPSIHICVIQRIRH